MAGSSLQFVNQAAQPIDNRLGLSLIGLKLDNSPSRLDQLLAQPVDFLSSLLARSIDTHHVFPVFRGRSVVSQLQRRRQLLHRGLKLVPAADHARQFSFGGGSRTFRFFPLTKGEFCLALYALGALAQPVDLDLLQLRELTDAPNGLVRRA
ncbi:hypothetical protein CE206_29655 (plasmid) [Achromobacter xylosoxidans]|nr:hypothetical protein CE206_29655 [Achromobacter xylosoxidans]